MIILHYFGCGTTNDYCGYLLIGLLIKVKNKIFLCEVFYEIL